MNFGDGVPFVTVIVPAYNAHTVLAPCLKRLTRQTYDSARYEVIVVDNGSTPDLRALTESFPGVIYLCEITPGSYAARNRGIAEASGEVLAFTDADCLPASNWIECGVARLLASPGCAQVGGHIELLFETPRCPTALEFCDYLSHGGFQQEYFIETDHFAATANAFMTRQAIEEIGNFNAALKSSGDYDWGTRAKQKGYRIVYAPDAIVEHPARTTLAQLIRKARRLQGGARDFFVYHPEEKDPPPSWKGRIYSLMLPQMSDDYRKIRSSQRLRHPTTHERMMMLSPQTILGALALVWLLRGIRFLEKARLALGFATFRG